MKSDSWDKFARLQGIVARQKADIEANPHKYLKRMSDEIFKLREGIGEATAALDGMDDFDMSQEEFPTMNPSIVETTLMRNTKALKILGDTLKYGN